MKENPCFAPLSQWKDPEVNLEKLPFWGALGSQGGAQQYGSIIKARKTSKKNIVVSGLIRMIMICQIKSH